MGWVWGSLGAGQKVKKWGYIEKDNILELGGMWQLVLGRVKKIVSPFLLF